MSDRWLCSSGWEGVFGDIEAILNGLLALSGQVDKLAMQATATKTDYSSLCSDHLVLGGEFYY